SPIGVPTAVPSAVWIRLPRMALERPPPEPGALVTVMKISGLSPGTPSMIKVIRIQASAPSATAVATPARIVASPFHCARSRRRRAATAGLRMGVAVALIGRRPGALPLDPAGAVGPRPHLI